MKHLLRFFLARERRAARIHYLGMLLGFTVTGSGSALAVYGDMLHAVTGLPHLTIDVVAYSIHGFGLIPVYRHFEHVWDAFNLAEDA